MKKLKISANFQNHFFNFIAVILGVYLAFYINERSNINAERKEKQALLQSLSEELNDDINTFETFQIPTNKEHLESIKQFIAVLDPCCLKEEDISKNAESVFQLQNYVPVSATYNSMKTSGKLKLIDDLALQKKLNNFYDGLVIECQYKSEVQVDFYIDELLKWLSTHVDLSKMEFLNLEDSLILRNKLIIYESLIDQKLSNYRMIVNKAKLLKQDIDANIEAAL